MQRVVIKLTKGLDIPIEAPPEQTIQDAPAVGSVALLGADYMGLRPAVVVHEGERVALGQPLFTDKNDPHVHYVSPGSGTVTAINRGARRALLSIVITLEGDDELEFNACEPSDITTLSEAQVKENLLASGLWTALRTRPFSKTPAPGGTPAALFVTAIDTNPLAPIPEVALEGREGDFANGLRALAKLCPDGPTYLCVSEHSDLPDEIDAPVQVERFTGPHPAGSVGLHIHLLRPASRNVEVWHIGYQEVASIGRLFSTGRLDVERVVSIGGPTVDDPRLVRTRQGAATDELYPTLAGGPELRVIAGSALSGKKSMGDAFGFLGRFDNQLTVLEEDREKVFLGWLSPGVDLYSTKPIYTSWFNPKKLFAMGTSTNGSPRAMVPIGMYEDVMPFDILPTHLLRALIVGDIETAEALGALELDEEDLALCTFVCPGKYEFGPILRKNLEMIEKEG